MRRVKIILFFAAYVFLLTSCSKKEISDNGLYNEEINDLYKEFLQGHITVENPFNPDFPITSYMEEYYKQEEEWSFPIETLEKKFVLVDLNDDQIEELIFKISSGPDEIVYILGNLDGNLKVYDVFEAHTKHISFNVYENGLINVGQNYNGDEAVYYRYSETGTQIEVIHFMSSKEWVNQNINDSYYEFYYIDGKESEPVYLADEEQYKDVVSEYQKEEARWYDLSDIEKDD